MQLLKSTKVKLHGNNVSDAIIVHVVSGTHRPTDQQTDTENYV